MLFDDRNDAGRRLARALAHYRGQRPLVLAIPRGAVPMGKLLAELLGGELDVVMVRKIGAPHQPEFALAAIDEAGQIYRNPQLGDAGQYRHYIDAEGGKQLDTIRHRRASYTPGRAPIDPAGRVVIVVDDGLATGSTMIAALHALREKRPARLVCAVPVAPPDTLERVRPLVDELVCLEAPYDFQAVGQFYRHFDQVEDDEVIAALNLPAAGPSELLPGPVQMRLSDVELQGELNPGDGRRMVLFAHGSGSSRHSPRNRYVAQVLNRAGIGTLLFDMLTEDEDRDYQRRFDIDLLAARLLAVTAWLRARHPAPLALGYFGASTGAAAALRAAAEPLARVEAVVSRGGRPDLAGDGALRRVQCPTLLLVGGFDHEVLALNRQALELLTGPARLEQIAGATHLFEEPGALEQVADLACDWFAQHLGLAPA